MSAALDSTEYELAMPHSAWEAAMRALFFVPQSVAVGQMRELKSPLGSRWLVDRLEIISSPPKGVSRPPTDDWIVVSLAEGEPVNAAKQLLDRCELRNSQRVAALMFSRSRREAFDAALYDEGKRRTIERLRLIGGMTLPFCQEVERFSPENSQRYSRTIGTLGHDDWRSLHQSHVILIGCGRNGSQLAWQLACLGIGKLSLVDGDHLATENLDAMPGLRVTDVGRPKARALAERLVQLRPDLAISVHEQPINEAAENLRSPAELVVSTVDDDAARLAASWLSRDILAPHLDAGSSVWRASNGHLELAGDVRMLLPYEGCVACVGGLDDFERCLYEFAAPRESLHKGEPVSWNAQRAGSLITLNGVVVSTAIQAWIDLMSGQRRGSYWTRISREAGGLFSLRGEPVGAASECPFCSASG